MSDKMDMTGPEVVLDMIKVVAPFFSPEEVQAIWRGLPSVLGPPDWWPEPSAAQAADQEVRDIAKPSKVGAGTRRQLFSSTTKRQAVAEAAEPGVSAAAVAEKFGVTPRRLREWRRQVARDADVATGFGGEVVSSPDDRGLDNEARELKHSPRPDIPG
jgi:transposase-like protein